ncbi:glucose 1-dehydrogenase [Cryptosporangium aurantiacum]|uniref:3alpha(Or 20beta)-hydroxysteroid dehydrogenase n=1 Tax=Cryptosporangium aurantiacum TaxID=134849 RepID=A0A1M7K843_9ACTN|nr:glucose 1-dehydrogenase [Cryptosporangium aurantiacum]SHM61408.1 3alpha(or 20beta)-hydroxysteroid dehydrogenase [Cryptosporangium aurantiacum]
MRLDGKIALITGAARGQGAAAARRFVAEGAQVLLTDVLDEDGAKLAAELGESAAYTSLDVAEEDAWAAAADLVKERYGRLDVLVNNAGLLHFSALADTSLAEYERVIRINQFGTFLGMRTAIPLMRPGGGSIVNVSSVEGLGGMPLLVAYSASKFAIRGMTKVAAMELGREGIRVNSVHPGAVDTPMVSNALGGVPIEMAPIGKKVALGRVGNPDEIANMVLFLASDESSYCTGGEFVVDGGATSTHALATILRT